MTLRTLYLLATCNQNLNMYARRKLLLYLILTIPLQNMKHLHIDLPDIPTSNLYPHLYGVVDFIYKAIQENGIVYVHCAAGISRSSTCTISFLMVAFSLSFEESLAALRLHRSAASPNMGFRAQLKKFESLEVPILREQMRKKYGEIKKLEVLKKQLLSLPPAN